MKRTYNVKFGTNFELTTEEVKRVLHLPEWFPVTEKQWKEAAIRIGFDCLENEICNSDNIEINYNEDEV